MKLVFIHGWGLSPNLWEVLATHLPYPHQLIDLGFFGKSTGKLIDSKDNILIGHSLGFIEGIHQKQDWKAWVAINSFPRFLKTSDKIGCTTASELREIRMRLTQDPETTLRNFQNYIGVKAPRGELNVNKLLEKLDVLRDLDIDQTLTALDNPGLVLASCNDPLVPIETSEALAKDYKIRWHDTAGHNLPEGDPVWCADIIKEFIETL